MKKILTFWGLYLALATSTGLMAQEVFQNEQYGFSMTSPEGWQVQQEEDILKNLDKYDFDEEQLQELLAKRNGSIPLISFFKYDPKTHAGLIPTIQILVRSNPTPSFEYFEQMINQSAGDLKNVLEDFTLIESPRVVEVSGQPAIFLTGTYSLGTKRGAKLYARTRVYAVPKGAYFFQIAFIDAQEGEDCSELFDALLQSIQISD
ncbi:MAG: hypothetical protein AAFW73_20705 [Bacteroidota bacterium]